MAPHPHEPAPGTPPHPGRDVPELPGLQAPLPERPGAPVGHPPDAAPPGTHHGADSDAPGSRHPPPHEVP